jgi:hypothetical protein
MRALHHHTHTLRRMLGALAVVVATTVVSASPALADDDMKSKTPLTAYKRFAFEFELGLLGENQEPVFTLTTKGTYVNPGSQDCAVTASMGHGVDFNERAVVVGNKMWLGHGGRSLKPVHRRAFEFESQCPSSAKFWKGFPIQNLPSEVLGTPEKRDGVMLQRVDVTNLFASIVQSGLIDAPNDVSAERAVVWATKHDGMVVGMDFILHASSPETCHDMLELDDGEPAPATCTTTIRLDLSRFDDRKVDVRAGGSKGHVSQA